MSHGFDSLHKVMKDATRRKILLLLNERGHLSYTDLMKTLEIENTGTLNYHLKILKDLVEKEDSNYSLTEKGKLAARLLYEYPEDKINASWQIHNVKDTLFFLVFNAIFLATIFALYFSGYIKSTFLMVQIILFTISVGTIFIVMKRGLPRRTYSPERMMTGYKIGYIILGMGLGTAITFAGGGLLILLIVSTLRSIGVHVILFDFVWWLIISPIIGSLLGSIGGYLFYKKSKYSKLC